MKQYIVDKAKSTILTRKYNAEHEFSKKMKPLYESEEFKDLNKELNREIINNARLESLGRTPDKSAEIYFSLKMKELKETFGVYGVKPNYTCEKCCDTGYIDGQMCQCMRKEISQILTKESGFGELVSFADSIKTCGADLVPFYKKMWLWCHSDFRKNLVFLAGATGVGKTYLLKCMANELIEQGKIVKIATAFAMDNDFKKFTKTNEDEILEKYITTEVLFIDDLGAEPLYKNITIEYFYLIINERKVRDLPTVITSNLFMSDIRRVYDERIYSRIADNHTSIKLLLSGVDKRREK